MRTAWLVLPVLAFELLAAHLLRGGWAAAAAAVALSPLLLLVRETWAARALQVVLILGALEWLRSLAELAGGRAARGEPLVRLVLILGLVALVTAAAVPVVEARRRAIARASEVSAP